MAQIKIGFIDYSREERNRILSTLKMLEERSALDELGIGVVRDAYADKLFPGISTLQTRAKYVVLIPYIFQTAKERAEKGKLANARVMLQWLNEQEDLLVETLKNHSLNTNGIIGINANKQKRSVKIKPSTIYWNGLRTFGILRRDNISIYDACKLICSAANRKSEMEIQTEGDSFDDPTARGQNNMVFLPIRQGYDYFSKAGIDLTREEAEFLKERILRSSVASDSLLGFFIREGKLCDQFDSVPYDKLPAGIRKDYLLAKDFAQFIYGAHIRYNVVFSDGMDEEMINEFESWRDEFLASPFDLDAVLGNVSCPPGLAHFCRKFVECVKGNDLSAMDDLIVERERTIKTTRAKLRKPEEYLYDPKNPIHHYKLDYRFSTAMTILKDIITGLEGEQHV